MTYLIQRFSKTPEGKKGWGNPFAFGAGRKDGGLSEEATNALAFLTPDYMGAAEYEFGKLPQSINFMIESRESYEKHEGEINGKPIYLFCFKGEATEILADLDSLARRKFEKGAPISRDSTHLDYAVGLATSEYNKTCAWLHLNDDWRNAYCRYPFFASTDKEVFAQFVGLFAEEEVSK